MSHESLMPSTHFILYCPFLLLPSTLHNSRVIFNEWALHIRRPKYSSFSFSISLSSEYSGLVFFRIHLLDLLAVQRLSRVFSNTTVQKRQFFSTQPSLWSNSHDNGEKHSFDCMDCQGIIHTIYMGSPTLPQLSLEVKSLPANAGDRRPRFSPQVWKISFRRAWKLTSLFLTGEAYGQRSLVGYGPQGRKEWT